MRGARALVASVTLLACTVPGAVVAGDNVLLLRLSNNPPWFLEPGDPHARSGPVIEVDWGTSKTGWLTPDVGTPWRTVRQPAPWIRGWNRIAFVSIDSDQWAGPSRDPDEGVARLDLFSNLRLTGSVGWTGHSTDNDYPLHSNAFRHFDQQQADDMDGALMVVGLSRELGFRRDILYANSYWAEGDYRILASGAPPSLGPIGLSFAGAESYRPARWSHSLDSTGFAVGLQTFFARESVNWTLELGHRQDLDRTHAVLVDSSATALTTRVQYRFAERFLLQMDAYHAMLVNDSRGPRNSGTDDGSSALHVELRVDF